MIKSDTQITTKIDWLSVTVGEVKYPPEWSKERAELPFGMLRYDTAIKYLDGRVELCSSGRKDMKPHVQFSGSTIDRICAENDIDTVDVLKAMSYGDPSRIDLALDIKHGSLDIEELSRQFSAGKAETSARSGLYLQGVKTPGVTLYVGAKGSEKRVRIYDKAAEQGIEDFEWTRIELQCRHASALAAMPIVIVGKNPHMIIAGIINGFISFPDVRDWGLVFGRDKLKPLKISQPESNRCNWLLDTAAKSLANEIVEGKDGELFLDKFLAVVAGYVNAKSASYTH